ncbi:MAG: ABC transporter ATP-binding protein [bacterium]|nr:ABC transporter ATP-binding protein [bacterium]
MALLEVEDLCTVFHTEDGVVHAVDGVSFQVEAGKILGIVGESGCGKSVTAMSVMRLIPDPPGRIESGRVLWKGRDLLAVDADEMPQIRGREIAMIFQDPMTSLNPVFTIGKQLGEVLDRRFDLRGAAADERMVEVLGHVGIADAEQRLSQYPHELSGGMKQRIMIAMALMCRPDLLIADEPTTALDVTVQAQILHLMKQLQQEFGTAIVLITHDMGVVAETCDDVVVMYAGKVVESCGVFELFVAPRHPYTRGLLDSILRPGRSKATPVPTIEGVVPSLLQPPAGCRFADRCARAVAQCHQDEPLLATVSDKHLVACHLPLEVPPS